MRTRLLVAFLIVALVPLVIASVITVLQTRAALQQQVLSEVTVLAEIEENHISNFLNQQLLHLALVTSRTQLRYSLQKFNQTGDKAALEKINTILADAVKAVPDFSAITVLNLEGEVVASTAGDTTGQKMADKDFFHRSLLTPKINGLFINDHGELELRLSGPLLLKQQSIGVLTITTKATPILKLTGSLSKLGKTGEVLLAQAGNQPGEATMVAPTRFSPDAAFSLTLKDSELPIVKAVAKQEAAYLDTEDYRGVRVIAASRYIDKAGWGLVVKIDQQEAFSSASYTQNLLIGSAAVIIAVTICLVHFVSTYLSRPIARLANIMQRYGQGEKDIRAHIPLSGELKTFASRFNEMADHLNQQLELERDLREASESSDRAKTTFLATISHELHTPLNHVINLTQEVLDSAHCKHQDRETLGIAHKSAQELLLLVDNILDFARLESGELKLHEQEFSLAETLGAVVKTLEPSTAEKQLSISLSVDPDLPQYVQGDANRIRQIVLNLAQNAIKYTHNGSIEIIAEPATKAGIEGDDCNYLNIHLAINDTGQGIPDEKRDEIFQAFTQAEDFLTRRVGGLGLGLALSARLVRLMAGRISVESTLGTGSTFHCYFTLKRAEPYLESKSEPEQLNQHLRILVVEDNAVNQLITRKILENWGHQVTIVEDGEQAVKTTEETDFDAILMDIQMPNMDGITATRLIRLQENNSDRHTPIIAVTAHAGENDQKACFEAGMDDFICKPLDKNRLKIALTKLA